MNPSQTPTTASLGQRAAELLRRARVNVKHSASHEHGAKSRELLVDIDAFLSIDTLAATAKDAWQDTTRLDWLDAGPDFRLAEVRTWLHERYKTEPHAGKLREAIDAAMSKSEPAAR